MFSLAEVNQRFLQDTATVNSNWYCASLHDLMIPLQEKVENAVIGYLGLFGISFLTSAKVYLLQGLSVMFDIWLQLMVSSSRQWSEDAKSTRIFIHGIAICCVFHSSDALGRCWREQYTTKKALFCVSFKLGKGSTSSWEIFESYRDCLFQTDYLS